VDQKTELKQSRKNETGYALVWTLVVLTVSGLILIPLLLLMTTGLVSSNMHEENTQRFYAADSGIEVGARNALCGETTVPTYELNGSNVAVTITEVTPTAAQRQDFGISEDDKVYEIISTATSIGDGSQPNTTILSYVSISGGWMEFGSELPVSGDLYAGSGNMEIDDDVYVKGNLTVAQGNLLVQEGVTVIVEEDVNVHENFEIKDGATLIVCGDVDVAVNVGNFRVEGTGIVIIRGDVDVAHGSFEIKDDTNVSICGNLLVSQEHKLEVYGTLSVGGEGTPVDENVLDVGDFDVYGDATVCGNAHVDGNLKVDNGATLCVAMDIDVDGSTDINGEYTVGEGCPECPLQTCPACDPLCASIESYEMQ